MSKNEPKKRVVVTTGGTPKSSATTSKSRASSAPSVKKHELVFGKDNYLWMLAGIGAIGLGLLMMSGGAMPSTDVWDESIIYSKRRTLFAPLVIIIGLVLVIVAIFRNPSRSAASTSSDLA